MTEFIGARISLVSRSDIRYVGTLHEINSNDSTVALENVTSFGTEGRKNNPDEEIPPSDSVYEYIVFRGSDVKDLRVEEPPAVKENKPPQVPNDPAILGSGSRPPPQSQASQQQRQQGPPGQQGQHQQGPGAPPFGQYPPPFYPPPGGFGRGGPPGGFPPMPFGAPPPGWYAPPNQGFPPAPFPPYGYQQQYGAPGQFQQQQQPPNQPPKPSPIGPGANKQPSTTPPTTQAPSQAPSQPSQANEKQPEPKAPVNTTAEMPAAAVPKPPTPNNASKPTASQVQAAISQPSTSQAPSTAPKAAAPKVPTPAVPKNRVITPAVPLPTTAPKAPLQTRTGNVAPTEPAAKPVDPAASLRDATQAATLAVAAAMAKLPPPGQTNGSAVDNLTRKVNEMRVNDAARAPRNPGGTGFAPRGGRGPRGGGRAANHKVEVPEADFDFASANAKFNKQDLVKEAIATGSPVGETAPVISPTESDTPSAGYNKATSFFDNISSEAKERAEGAGNRPGGREWRGEEQKKNVETFGQGSVDNGYRGGYRGGRGRGRGRGNYRGRGGYGGNGQPGQTRGGYRSRGDAQASV